MKSKSSVVGRKRLTTLTETLPQHIKSKPISEIRLRILATSDLHANIMPYDYYSGAATNRLGLTRTASLIKTARAEVQNCLLFDNGDFLIGSPLGDYIAQASGPAAAQTHPMIAAMNHLAYDAGTLGNHEFNLGLDFLQKAIADADFPIVAANVLNDTGPSSDTTFVPPYVILRRTVIDTNGSAHLIKIGVIGFTPPQIMLWDHMHLRGKLITRDIVETAVTYVPQILHEGADLIIALSHSGIGSGTAIPGMENASTALAHVTGIDAVITGHVHLVFPSDDFKRTDDVDQAQGTLCGKPAVMPGFYGSHLGVIDLVLTQDHAAYKVQSHTTEARPIWCRAAENGDAALVESDPDLLEITMPAHLETLEWASQPIGHTDLPLHSFFALLTEPPALQLVAAAQALHAAVTLAPTLNANLPILASVAAFKAGGRGGPENYTDIPAGDLRLRNAADLYIYPNSCVGVQMSGAEIADWLEYAVGIFNQIPPASTDHALINTEFPSFNFDMIFGLQFEIDLSQPPKFDLRGTVLNPNSQRIVGLTYKNTLLDPTAVFAVATNSYRLATNGGFLRANADQVLYQSPDTNLEAVLRYFSTTQNISFGPTRNRRFSAMPGTTVTFDTSPDAQAHMADLAPMKIDPVGRLPNGFMRFRLHL